MPTVKVRNLKNKEVGEIKLSAAVFGVELNEALIHAAVKNFRANGRQGTSATKTRGNVSGSGRKLWKQKKTGRARVGSIRSSIWRHGGTVFGPHPNEYGSTLPKRMRKNAMRSVLSSKLRTQRVRLVDSLDLPSAKTKDLVKLLKTLQLEGKVLLVDKDVAKNLDLAARNLQKVGVAQAKACSGTRCEVLQQHIGGADHPVEHLRRVGVLQI